MTSPFPLPPSAHPPLPSEQALRCLAALATHQGTSVCGATFNNHLCVWCNIQQPLLCEVQHSTTTSVSTKNNNSHNKEQKQPQQRTTTATTKNNNNHNKEQQQPQQRTTTATTFCSVTTLSCCESFLTIASTATSSPVTSPPSCFKNND